MRHQKVDYRQVASMIRVAVAIRGEDTSLSVLVDDMSRKLSLGIDTQRVQRVLGSKVVEKVEDCNGYRSVRTMVVV